MRNGTPFLLLPATPEYALDMCVRIVPWYWRYCTEEALVQERRVAGAASPTAYSRIRRCSTKAFRAEKVFTPRAF